MKRQSIGCLAVLLAVGFVAPAARAADPVLGSDAAFVKELQSAPIASAALDKDVQYRLSVEFEAVTRQIYRNAWTALSEKARAAQAPAKWAIVLDADDTVLDNTPYQIESKGVFNPATWDAWVKRKACGVVPGAKEFLDQVRTLPGHHIVFITDRNNDQEAATVENMRATGLFKDGDLILTKKDKQDVKEVRRLCVEKGLDPRCQMSGPMPILALFGDSARDFEELYGQDMKEKGRERIAAEAGKKYWMIPNPMYGQWSRDYK
ncbi:MAG: hypothetical protein HYZ74_01110 [Elusimicrobia bacterium]|nr:hypothetical protein [Elusimicrobiota bacterium]